MLSAAVPSSSAVGRAPDAHAPERPAIRTNQGYFANTGQSDGHVFGVQDSQTGRIPRSGAVVPSAGAGPLPRGKSQK